MSKDKADKYVVVRHVKANDRGWGKYHLAVAETKSTVCSVKLRRPVDGRYTRPIEEALQALRGRAQRYSYNGMYAVCQNCVKRAQRLRNPLDRLADIKPPAP